MKIQIRIPLRPLSKGRFEEIVLDVPEDVYISSLPIRANIYEPGDARLWKYLRGDVRTSYNPKMMYNPPKFQLPWY